MVQGLEIVKKTKPLEVVFFKYFLKLKLRKLFTIICNEMQL